MQSCRHLSLSLGMWSMNYSNLHSYFTQSDSCKRMCEKTNHFKPHPVKHGMWINVPCISAHYVLIFGGMWFLRSVEEFEDMAQLSHSGALILSLYHYKQHFCVKKGFSLTYCDFILYSLCCSWVLWLIAIWYCSTGHQHANTVYTINIFPDFPMKSGKHQSMSISRIMQDSLRDEDFSYCQICPTKTVLWCFCSPCVYVWMSVATYKNESVASLLIPSLCTVSYFCL